jgi:NADPH2 dehydrogenase
MVAEYYAQRASTPGTLLIAEATFISPRASGQANAPGVWNVQQIEAWRRVTDAVHARGCFIFLQLWALGRRANPDLLARAEGGPYPVVGPSPIPMQDGAAVPRELSRDEIRGFVEDYAAAGRNAMLAGFDGVEVHAANGYLVDQFCQAASNTRTDEYGGSVANRSRFAVEVAQALIEAVGDSKKVALRLSPWSEVADEHAVVEQFGHVITELKKLDMAYLHLVESRVGGVDARDAIYHNFTGRNDPFVEIWGQAPLILAGGFTPETATYVVGEYYKDKEVCIAFGRYYISTPDLPFRLRKGLPLNPYDRGTFYKAMSSDGYTDYPFSEEYLGADVK